MILVIDFIGSRAPFVDGVALPKNLIHLQVLDLLERTAPAYLLAGRVAGGEGHAVDELGDALAVGVVEDLADHALQKHLFLELDLLRLRRPASLLRSIPPPRPLPLPRLTPRFRHDKAPQTRRRGVEFHRRALLPRTFAHSLTK